MSSIRNHHFHIHLNHSIDLCSPLHRKLIKGALQQSNCINSTQILDALSQTINGRLFLFLLALLRYDAEQSPSPPPLFLWACMCPLSAFVYTKSHLIDWLMLHVRLIGLVVRSLPFSHSQSQSSWGNNGCALAKKVSLTRIYFILSVRVFFPPALFAPALLI